MNLSKIESIVMSPRNIIFDFAVRSYAWIKIMRAILFFLSFLVASLAYASSYPPPWAEDLNKAPTIVLGESVLKVDDLCALVKIDVIIKGNAPNVLKLCFKAVWYDAGVDDIAGRKIILFLNAPSNGVYGTYFNTSSVAFLSSLNCVGMPLVWDGEYRRELIEPAQVFFARFGDQFQARFFSEDQCSSWQW